MQKKDMPPRAYQAKLVGVGKRLFREDFPSSFFARSFCKGTKNVHKTFVPKHRASHNFRALPSQFGRKVVLAVENWQSVLSKIRLFAENFSKFKLSSIRKVSWKESSEKCDSYDDEGRYGEFSKGDVRAAAADTVWCGVGIMCGGGTLYQYHSVTWNEIYS